MKWNTICSFLQVRRTRVSIIISIFILVSLTSNQLVNSIDITRRSKNKVDVNNYGTNYRHHVHVQRKSKYSVEKKIRASLFDPNHPDVAYLKTLSQFFKVYNTERERTVQDGIKVLNTIYGKTYLEKMDTFRGRASMFEKNGVLADYKPLLHELAAYHDVPKENAVDFSISFLEEHADKWHMRVEPEDKTPPKDDDPVRKNWNDGKIEEEGTRNALLQGAAEKEDDIADAEDLEADMLEEKAAKEAKDILTAKNKLKANGMAQFKVNDLSQKNNQLFFIQVPTLPKIVQKNENKIKKELAAARKRVTKVIKSRGLKINDKKDQHTFFNNNDISSNNGEGFLTRMVKKHSFYPKPIGNNFETDYSEERHNADAVITNNFLEQSSTPVEHAPASSLDLPAGIKQHAPNWSFDDRPGTNFVNPDIPPPQKFDVKLPGPTTYIYPGSDFNLETIRLKRNPFNRCPRGSVQYPDKITCHTYDESALRITDEIQLVPDITKGKNWFGTDTGTAYRGSLNKSNAVEFQIFAPSGRYFQWHIPRKKKVHLNLNIKMSLDKSRIGKRDNSNCPLSNYEISIDPKLQEKNLYRAKFYAGGDNDFNGNFAGDHYLKFSKDGVEINIQDYELQSPTKGESVTSCFKAIRIFTNYDKSKVCNDYEFQSGKLQIQVSPFKPKVEYKDGPYLTVVDKCPFVHEAAVNVAEKLREGRPISHRLCQVLKQIAPGREELQRLLKKVCPFQDHNKNSTVQILDKDKESDAVDKDIKKKVMKLFKKRLRVKPGPKEKVKKLRKQAEEHRKRKEELEQMMSPVNCEKKCTDIDPCQDVLGGQPNNCKKCSPQIKAGWVAGLPAPPEAIGMIVKEKVAKKKRVKAYSAAAAAGSKNAAANGAGPMAGAMAAPIGPAVSKVIRNAIALSVGMVLSMWMGKQSAPWRYDGSHPFICFVQRVEMKDKCNRDRDKVLAKLSLPPPMCLLCNFFNFPIIAPPIEILFKNPPPVGIGPLPPYIVPPCHGTQSPPEKKSADEVMKSIIEDLKVNTKKLAEKIKIIATQMQQAADNAASAQAAAAATFLELPSPRIGSTASAQAAANDELSVSSAFLELPPAMTAQPGGDPEKAKELFDAATVMAKNADVEYAEAKVAIRELQLRQANYKDEPWPICRAKLNLEKAKKKLKKAEVDLKAAQKTAGGAKSPKDDPKHRNVPDLHENPGVPLGLKKSAVCPKYDLFGCACPEVPDSTTLSVGDCSALKGIRSAEYQAEKDMMFATAAMNAANQGAQKAAHKKKAIDKEDDSMKKPPKKKKKGHACPTGHYCPNNVTTTPCPPGSFRDAEKVSSPLFCIGCPVGYYQPASGSSTCLNCSTGFQINQTTCNPQNTPKPGGIPAGGKPGGIPAGGKPGGIPAGGKPGGEAGKGNDNGETKGKKSDEPPTSEPQLPNKDAQEGLQGGLDGAPVVAEAQEALRSGADGGGSDTLKPTEVLKTNAPNLAACRSMGCQETCAKRAHDLRSNLKFCNCNCCADGTGFFCWECASAKAPEPQSCSTVEHIGLPLENHPIASQELK